MEGPNESRRELLLSQMVAEYRETRRRDRRRDHFRGNLEDSLHLEGWKLYR